ncbi:MAG: AtpZ/AtpI family protein [Flavobacteriales bacterium]
MSAQDDLRRARKGYESYLRYTGLGLTMLGIVLAFTFAGWWLDRQLRWPFPVLTLALSLLGIAGAMIHLFKETAKR